VALAVWHGRFGHLGFDNLQKLVHNKMVRGLPSLDHVNQVCGVCLAGKQRRAPFPDNARRRAAHALDLVHGDLCGPISPPTPSGNMYLLVLISSIWDQRTKWTLTRALIGGAQPMEGWWASVA